jgi:hypothetical protein
MLSNGKTYMNESSGENKEENKINKWRVIFAIAYFLSGCLIIWFFRKDMFYLSPMENTYNFYRFLWCVSSTFFGFSAIAFGLRCHKPSPFPEYLFHYPLQIFAMSSLVFGVLHLWDRTVSYVFYYLSFGICFTLGFLVDQYWVFIKELAGKLKPR